MTNIEFIAIDSIVKQAENRAAVWETDPRGDDGREAVALAFLGPIQFAIHWPLGQGY
ncbi:MAG: hypothetical protein ACLQVN_00690 [Bryobacteraceae bacterium]